MLERFNGLETALSQVPDGFVVVLTVGHDHPHGVSALLEPLDAETTWEPSRSRCAADAVRMAITEARARER